MNSKAQKEAQKRYNARNPERTDYSRFKGAGKMFVMPSDGTRAAKAIKWGIREGRYKDDLKALRDLIDERLHELSK